MIRTPLRRTLALGGALALVLGVLAAIFQITPAKATPLPPATGSCTYTDGVQSSSQLLVVNTGDTINVTCTGLTTDGTTVENGAVALAQASGLAGIADGGGGQSGFADQTHIVLGAASGGSYSGSFVVHGTGDATNPFTPNNADPNATCPPTQAEINVGITTCAIAVADVATLAGLNTVLLQWASSSAPAANPALTITPGSGVAGDVVTPSIASGQYWGSAILGSGTPAATASGIPAPVVLIDGSPATNNVVLSAAAYCATGHSTARCTAQSNGTLLPSAMSGTITTPTSLLAAGNPHAVTILEPNATAFPGNGPGGTTVAGGGAFNVFGGPSISLSTAQAGNGVAVTVNGSNWDKQGGAVTISFTCGGPGCSGAPAPDSVSVPASAISTGGAFSTSISVTANETRGSNPITASQTALGGQPLSASQPFTVLSFSTGPCTTTGGVGNTCTINQKVQVVVNGVANGLSISEHTPTNGACAPPAGSNNVSNALNSEVDLTPITLNGKTQHATGCLNTVQVEDIRGGLPGWNLTGQMETDFGTGSAGSHAWDKEIPASNLVWLPSVGLTYAGAPNGPSGVLSEVASGGQAAGLNTGPNATQLIPGFGQNYGQHGLILGNVSPDAALHGAGSQYGTSAFEVTTPTPLCAAAPGGGGGTFDCDAGLDLVVPAFVSSGTYAATMDLVVQ